MASSHDAPTRRVPPPATAAPARMRARPLAFASVLLLLAGVSAYLVAAIALRLDQIFLPGNEISLPAALRVVPGLSTESTTATIPGDRINILVLGLDRRPSEGKDATRSDTMFVLTMDPATKTGGVLSIPRDLWLDVPNGRGGWTSDRINEAYGIGAKTGYRDGGLGAARDTVQHNFPQIRLDYELVIDFSSFIKMVDTLGGIDVDIAEGFRYDEAVSVDDRNGVFPSFKKGVEHMTGERALYYSRYRGGVDGDFGRIRRQQQVMMAVANKALSIDAASRSLDLFNRFRDSIDTDIPAFRVPGIALLAKQVGLDKVTMLSLGDVVKDYVTAGGAEVLVAEPADMARVVNQLFVDPRLTKEGAMVEVQNATPRSGLATQTAGYLVQRGLPSTAVTTGAAASGIQEETVIFNYHAKDYTARQVAEWLGLPTSRVRVVTDTRSATGGPDIVVVLGRDAKLPGGTPVAGAGTGAGALAR